MTTPTEIDHRVVDAVQRSAARFDVTERPVAQVRARAGQRRRRRRTTSSLAALTLLVGGGLATALIVSRDEPTVASAGGFAWTRLELPLGNDGAAGMLAVDGAGPFFGVEYVEARSDRTGVALSLDGVAWQPLRSAPPLVGSALGFPPAITAVGDRVALVGRLAADHDGLPTDTLVLITSADRGATWRTTALETELTDIWSVAVALEPDDVLIALAGDAAPPSPQPTDPREWTGLMQLQRVDERGVVSRVSTAMTPEVESWTLVMLDESAEGLVLSGGRTTLEWTGNVFVRRFIDDADRWTELGPAAPSPLSALSLDGDTTLAVGTDAIELPDGSTSESLHAQVRSAWVPGAWQSTALDRLLPARVRHRATFTVATNRWTVENGPAGLAIAARVLERDETASPDGGLSWIREQGVSPLQLLWSADGTSWTALPLDELTGAKVFFARPLMRNDGTLIVATYVEPDLPVAPDVEQVGRTPWRTIVLVGEPTG